MSSILRRPSPGNRYIVVSGDRLDNIEKSAYGSVQNILENANIYLQNRASNGNISLENRPTIYPGDVLTIPELPAIREIKTTGVERRTTGLERDQITIKLGGRTLDYESARVLVTMDTATDGWSARIQWQPGQDPELDKLLLPYTYPSAQVYIGNELVINGALYAVNPEQTTSGLTMNLEGFSFTADVIDSTMPLPYVAANITLKERADQLLRHLGLESKLDTGVDGGGSFDRVTGEVDDTIYDHLVSLASQRGLLVSSTATGNILFTRTTQSAPVGTISTGDPLPTGWGASFDGRGLYNVITALGESPGGATKQARVTDDNIPKSRFLTFRADDTTEGTIEAAAAWRRTKQFADALSIPYPVSGYYAPDGSRFRQNTKITIVSPEIFVPDGYTFLIKQVEYQSSASGQSSTLSLVPPGVYTGGDIELPWRTT